MAGTDVAVYENASPSLLAATPSQAPIRTMPEGRDWQDLRLQQEQRLYALRTWRLSWWQHWAEIAENLLPRRYHWLIVPNVNQRGNAINRSIKDPTASQALRICTAGMRSGLMSSSRPWFKMKPGNKGAELDQAARAWFDAAESVLYAIMAGSNFYTAGTQMFEDLTAFGTSPEIIYEDREDIIRCFVPCCGEYYLGADSTFRIDSFYRTFNLTTLQLVGMFGLGNVGSEVQTLWNQKGPGLDQEFVVAHSIEPNFPVGMAGQNPKLGVVPGSFTYREVYWLWGRSTNAPLSMRGFMEKPFIAPRWATTSNDPYGRSPGMDALPDILQLQVMTLRNAEAIEKMNRPPMLADAGLKNQPSSILPGRVTYVSDIAKGGMRPMYEVKPDIAAMTGLIEAIEKRIERWFFNDLFQMMEQLEGVQPRNAIEIAERRGEKMQVLGPVVEQVENELAAAVRRIYQIAKRRGLIPPLPQSLQGQPLHIDIRSMVALAQEAATTASMERLVQVGSQMQQFFPDKPPLDNLDSDAFFREYADMTAVPAKLIISQGAVDQVRAARAAAVAKQQQAQAQMQAATHAAPALAAAGKDASETQVGGGLNALGLLTGMGGTQDGIQGVAS